ncbi:MAG: hypothetical protein MJZ87_05765 [Bacteroidales bacterium]|nr:hypothetical protein [Bacteroidales bacterium]
MKKFLISVLCILLFVPNCVQAQHLHSDLYNGIGLNAGPVSGMGALIYGSVGFWEALGSGISKKASKMDMYGHYGLHYYYQVKPWCQIGVKATVESMKMTHFTDTTRLVIKDQYVMSFITLMPSVRFTYLNRPWVRLYSGIDVGCSYLFDSRDRASSKEDNEESGNNKFLFACNISPIGLEVGKKFYGLLETNIGYDSFVKIGIGARF